MDIIKEEKIRSVHLRDTNKQFGVFDTIKDAISAISSITTDADGIIVIIEYSNGENDVAYRHDIDAATKWLSSFRASGMQSSAE